MSKPKKLAAMDLLVKSASIKPAMSQNSPLSRNAVANLQAGTPVEISPRACRRWKLYDRPETETGHKLELAASFRQAGLGQIQPIVVRAVNDPAAPEIHYEVVCGQVRWLAAKELDIPVQAIVRELTDREAYTLMSVENRLRRKLSDYAKAKSYQQALAEGVFGSAQDLAEAEGISASKLSQFLGFAELPAEVVEHFAAIAKIPYRLGYEINKACKALGPQALIPLIPQIESGELPRSEVQRMQVPGFTAPPPDRRPPSSADAQAVAKPDEDSAPPPPPAPIKKAYISATGLKLFTYSQASRGWLIRIAPEVSAQMDEAMLVEFGLWLEAYLQQPGKRHPPD